MRRFHVAILLVGLLSGCATPIARNERFVAKHIGQSISIEGDYQFAADGEAIRTDWGKVIVQRTGSQGIPPGVYVRGTGVIDRGHLVNGQFIADVPDSHGVRAANDLVLRNAHLEIVPRPSTQPTGWALP
jgi:hypothetical protein